MSRGFIALVLVGIILCTIGNVPNQVDEVEIADSQGTHITLVNSNTTGFTIHVTDIPLRPSLVHCQTYRPQDWIVDFSEVKYLNQPDLMAHPSEDTGFDIVDEVTLEYDLIPAGMTIFCTLNTSDLDENPNSRGYEIELDLIQFTLSGAQDPIEHLWENFTVENDEDFLWVKWDAAQNQDELFAWVKLRIIRPSASNPSAGGETRSSHLEPGAIYIGGIRDGEHRVSLIGMSHDGQLTKPQWFSFENPGDRCDPDRTACPQIISSF